MHLFILFLISITSASFAGTANSSDISDLLHCLAMEEQSYHKEKVGGSRYWLNQKVFNELARNPNFALKRSWIKPICNSKNGPAFALISAFIIEPGNSFSLRRGGGLAGLKSWQERFSSILLGFLLYLQGDMKSHDCLVRNIPELEKFYIDYKYLAEYNGTMEILLDRGRGKTILSKLAKKESYICLKPKGKK